MEEKKSGESKSTKTTTSGWQLTVMAALTVLVLLVAVYMGAWGSNTEKYDWAHGYDAHKNVSYEHVQKWVDKHWTGSDANYKYQLQCFLKDPDFYDHNKYSVKTVKAWYKYCYRNGQNVRGWDIATYVKERR